jgi:hypothetical protein
MHSKRLKYVVPALGLVLTACGGGSDNAITDTGSDENNSGNYQQAVIDAQTGTGYLNLTTGRAVGKDDTWHVAFNRNAAMLNSGASGSGQVGGALGDAQDGFYKASGDPDLNVFLNASPDGELSHLQETFSEPATWVTDAAVSAFGKEWYDYDFASHTVVQADNIGYLVRSAEGDSYARMRIKSLRFSQSTQTFELEFKVQASGTSQFAPALLTFQQPGGYTSGDVCFDFDADATVDCATSSLWDVKIGIAGRSVYLKTNSGPSGSGQGAAVGPFDWNELKTYTSATTDPTGQSLKPAYVPDATGGIFTDSLWYEYNLQGTHKLWPNYRVYLINADTTDASAPVYALQIISYYGTDGNSGQPVVRWKDVSLNQGK